MCGVTESAGLVGEQRLIEAIVVEVIVVIAAEAAVGDFVNRIVNSGCRKFNSNIGGCRSDPHWRGGARVF